MCDTIDADLEVEVWSGRPASHANVADRRTHGNTRAGTHARREIAHMTVAADHAVAVPDVDHVAVSTFPASEDHHSVTDGTHRSPFGRRVIGTGVIAPLAEDRMLARAEHAADSTKRQRSAEKRRAKGHATRVVKLPGARARRIKVNRLQRVVSVGKREPRAEDLVDYDRAVGLLKSLNQEVELVALMEIATHVDLVLEDIGERPRELMTR